MIDLAFFRPEFFWALLFSGVIVLIHLLKRPKTINLEFSTLRFFQNNAVKSSYKRKVRNLLQLLFRLLLIILLILIFAHPFNRKNILNYFGNPQASVFVWIDQSSSMEYLEGKESLGQQAFNITDSIRDILPSTSKLYLYNQDDNKFKDYKKIDMDFKSIHALDQIENVFREFLKEHQKSSNAVLVLCSDLQRRSSKEIGTMLTKYPDIPVVIIGITPSSPWNYSIRNAEFDNGTIRGILNANGKVLESAKVTAFTNKMRIGETAVTLKKDEIEAVEIETGIKSGIVGQVKLSLNDPLLFDNSDYFSSDIKMACAVTIVGNVAENFVISAALRAANPEKWNPVTMKSEEEVTYDDLDTSDIVIFNSIRKPSRIIDAFLNNKKTECRSILFCCNPADSLNLDAQLLGKSFESFENRKSKKLEKGVNPVLPDTISELWRSFNSVRASEVSVGAYRTGLPGEPVLKFNNGDVFLSKTVDKGMREWIISAAQMGLTGENNLYQTGFFVPFLDRVMQKLNKQTGEVSNNWIAGEIRKNPFYNKTENVIIEDYNGKRLNNIKLKPTLSFGSPGVYKVISEGTRSFYIKVVSDPQESTLEYQNPEVNRNNKMIVVLDHKTAISSIQNSTKNVFWLIPWFLLGLVIISEILLWESNRKRNS